MNFIGLAEYYNCRPSSFICQDEYTAYCFDEVCAYINSKVKNGEKPNFNKTKMKKKYKSFRDYYNDMLS